MDLRQFFKTLAELRVGMIKDTEGCDLDKATIFMDIGKNQIINGVSKKFKFPAKFDNKESDVERYYK